MCSVSRKTNREYLQVYESEIKYADLVYFKTTKLNQKETANAYHMLVTQ